MMPTVGAKPPADSKTCGTCFFVLCLIVEFEFHQSCATLGVRSRPTASMRDFRRKGSSISPTPHPAKQCPRAELLRVLHELLEWSLPDLDAKLTKTEPSLPHCEQDDGQGKLQHHRFPACRPNTIIAAVGCRIWPRFPPSR